MNRFLIVIIAAFLFGCASTGARYDQAAVKKITPSVTSEADLVKMFGEPYRREPLADGRQRVTWQYTKGAMMVGVTEQHVLLVTLGSNRTVETFEERNR
jgi:hypothetical protein